MDLRQDTKRFLRDSLLLLDKLRDKLSMEEWAEIQRFIEHDEIGEALRALLWIIEEEKKDVSDSTIAKILTLADGLVEPMHLPERFRQRFQL